MTHPLDRSLPEIASALRRRAVSATELAEAAIERHERRGARTRAYKHFDAARALEDASRADCALAGASPPPLCGVPVSVKDLYGVEGMPTFAGTRRALPERWTRDAWLVGRLRAQGAVFVGKTHTVELAYGAVGLNPNWETPRNPWDAAVDRVPGGSSSGAGVSLHEGSALVALGSDTGGSIRIPASMTGTVGHKTTQGRWPTDGVVPLSHTLDTVGALTRSVADSVYFFGAVDPDWEDPAALLRQLEALAAAGLRVGVPRGAIWAECQSDVASEIERAIGDALRAGWQRVDVDGRLLDQARDLYMNSGIAGVECLRFLEAELPDWLPILHPIVGRRVAGAAGLGRERYEASLAEQRRLAAAAEALFDDADVLALPSAMITPPPLSDVEDPERYVQVNATALRPTCPASILGLCALSIPVGLDEAGMPVGLQLVAPGGRDEVLLAAAIALERILGTAAERLGRPPDASTP